MLAYFHIFFLGFIARLILLINLVVSYVKACQGTSGYGKGRHPLGSCSDSETYFLP